MEQFHVGAAQFRANKRASSPAARFARSRRPSERAARVLFPPASIRRAEMRRRADLWDAGAGAAGYIICAAQPAQPEARGPRRRRPISGELTRRRQTSSPASVD